MTTETGSTTPVSQLSALDANLGTVVAGDMKADGAWTLSMPSLASLANVRWSALGKYAAVAIFGLLIWDARSGKFDGMFAAPAQVETEPAASLAALAAVQNSVRDLSGVVAAKADVATLTARLDALDARLAEIEKPPLTTGAIVPAKRRK